MSIEKHFERVTASVETGLSNEQIALRIESGYVNTPVEPPSKTIQEIIISNTFTYFNLVFAVIAALLILVGSYRDLTFLPVVISNTLIGIIQEIRSKRTLDKLSVLHAPRATVVRSGKKSIVPAEELVIDDIVIFQSGNQIPADAYVVKGEVSVNESLITGESDEILKKEGDSLLSGSFIVSGRCFARLDKVGADSYVSKLTLEAKAVKDGEQSEMIRSLNILVLFAGIIIIPIAFMLVGQQLLFAKASLQTAITSMVAAVIGMIPEGLYLLSSVALAVSVIRLANQKVLVHDMKCIETLARVNVLCVDKTGTITETNMKVHEMIPLNTYDESLNTLSLMQIIGDLVYCMEKDNMTMTALKQYFRENSGASATMLSSFSSTYKYSSATFGLDCYILGAPEFVLREDYKQWSEQIEEYVDKGYRVLVFGQYDGIADGKELTKKVTPYSLILLSNPIRKEAKKTFQYFAEQGVAIKVISGDNPVTVSKVALEAGIEGAEQYIDAVNLSTEEEIANALKQYTVFGRVNPNQKRQFVKALQDAGNTVAMTGDGVNDVLALKDADCSVAMASGSDAACQASQLVLLDSNFSCMPSVVFEGRRVVNNIQRSASLFLVKNIFSFLMALFSISFMLEYPLEPSQISLVSMFTIGVPGFFLALEPNKNRIEGNFLRNVILNALPSGLTNFVIVGAIVVFGKVFEISTSDISVAATFLMAVVGLMTLYHVSKPMTWIRWGIFSIVVFGILFCIIFLSDLFAISPISLKCAMLFVLFIFVTEPVLRYIRSFIVSLDNCFIRFKEKRHHKKHPEQ